MDIRYIASAGYDFFTEPCTGSGVEIYISSTVWNGTGILDIGGDWTHSKKGIEASYAMRTGTNGLDADLSNNDKMWFSDPDGGEDITDYDVVIIWTKVLSWGSGKEVSVTFHSLGSPGGWGTSINLSDYISISDTDVWQRAVVPLSYLGIINIEEVDILELGSDGNIHLYLDDIAFGVGYPVPIGDYSMYGDDFGGINIQGSELLPQLAATSPSTPSMQAQDPDLRPSMSSGSSELGLRAYPEPT